MISYHDDNIIILKFQACSVVQEDGVEAPLPLEEVFGLEDLPTEFHGKGYLLWVLNGKEDGGTSFKRRMARTTL